MAGLRLLSLLLCLVLSSRPHADDLDAYAPAPGRHAAYLHLLLDPGDVEEDTVICRMHEDCMPPFTSPRAWAHLQKRYAPEADVTAPGVFLAVLAAVLDRPDLDRLSVAVSIPNHADNSPTGDSPGQGGATFLQGFRALGEHREQTLATLGSLPVLAGPDSHAMQPREAYLEWLRYLGGGDVALGANTVGNYGRADPFPDLDPVIVRDGRYVAPVPAEQCPRFYSLLFALGAPRRDGDLDSAIAAATGLPGESSLAQVLALLHDPQRAPLLPGGGRAVLRGSWLVTSAGRREEVRAYAQSVAGGTLYVDDPVALEGALADLFAQMLGGDDLPYQLTFTPAGGAAAGVLPDVFLTLNTGSQSADWRGNIKKLHLLPGIGGRDDAPGTADPARDAPMRLLDATGKPALVSAGERSGLLRADALTFWTDAQSLPLQYGGEHTPHTDGARVDRGGVGQKIDGFVSYADGRGGYTGYLVGDSNDEPARAGYAARQVYTSNALRDGLSPLNADDETAQRLVDAATPGALSTAQALELARWLRGQDAFSGLQRPRSWLLGQVAHSRPVAVNYGIASGAEGAEPLVRLFFGSGEGLFHVVENTGDSGRESGREVFAFLPPEVVDSIARRYRGELPPGQPAHGPGGRPVALVVDHNRDGVIDTREGDRVHVYFGLRRGGRSYYALDASDASAPPRLLWRIAATVDGDFDELGLAFSTPVVGTVNYRGTPEQVVIFAGGYHGGWSPDMSSRVGKDASAADDVIGNAIYIVSADTGELVWKAVRGTTGAVSNAVYAHAGLVDSIPSRVTPLRGASGVIERLYVGDTGGAVWRVDLPPGLDGDVDHRRDHWFITRLADLGADASEPGGDAVHDRRFFHAPDVVRSRDSAGSFDGVLIQSGDRAHPNAYAVDNFLFYIKDREVQSGSDALLGDDARPTLTIADLPDQSDCRGGTEIVQEGGVDTPCAQRRMASGWKIGLAGIGEKGLSSPLVDGGRVFFTTFTPGDPGACPARAGSGRVYAVSLADATAAIEGQRFRDLGPGIPDEVRRIADFLYVPGRPAQLYDLDGDGDADASPFLPSLAGRRYALYWRESGVDPL